MHTTSTNRKQRRREKALQRPWYEADLKWFTDNPQRAIRVRAPFAGEAELAVTAGSLPPDALRLPAEVDLFVAVKASRIKGKIILDPSWGRGTKSSIAAMEQAAEEVLAGELETPGAILETVEGLHLAPGEVVEMFAAPEPGMRGH